MKKLTLLKNKWFLQLLIFCIIGAEIVDAQVLPSNTSKTSPGSGSVVATIDVTKTGTPIHRYVYGMFTELLGNMFEQGVWAEMLSDRKFFYPVDTTARLNPVNTRHMQNRWRPVGSADAVIMDLVNPFVGEHSPLIKLNGSQVPGIQQTGLAIRSGKVYTGHIVLSGDPGVRIEISLVWGTSASEKQTISINALTSDYKKYPFTFTAGGNSDIGRIEITGSGTGSFHIGAVSLIPGDNTKGFRTDLITLLKGLNSSIYRWPGGNMLAGYDWRDGIGDPDKRAPRYDYAWNAVESNDVGTDEYLTMCELLGIDPFIVVNIGFGDAYSAAQWVEYVNGAENTSMGNIRAQNGHPSPYKVKWWGIGNEMYGEWQLGHMSIQHYILKHNMFAKAMRDVDPAIKLIASGATPFETSTTARHHRLPLPSLLPYKYGSPEDWTGNLLSKCSDNIDFVSEHLYPVTNQAFNIDSQKFVPVNDPLIDRVRRVANRVRGVAEAWDEYIKRMPELKNRNITFALDEWTGGGRGMERTLCAAVGLHEIFRHSDIITMGGYTAFTGCVAFNPTDAAYSATGFMFKMYREHFGTIPVVVTGNSPQHSVKGTVGVDKPAISSGSDTYPLDVMAALSEDRKKVTVAVINPTELQQEMTLKFTGVKFRDNIKVYTLNPPELMSTNSPTGDTVVTIKESTVKKAPEKILIAPYGISLFELELK